MATKKSSRQPINGVVLLDKPKGLSSNDALIRVKRTLNALKAGHTGTLDPFATGLLPLCFGEATKFSHDLLNADKTYETTVVLGVKTTTGDIEGDIVETKAVEQLQKEEVIEVVSQFIGEIEQVPPMYSALKRNGKPLYEYAREGIVLEREKRKVVIYDIAVKKIDLPLVTLEVSCSKGTYIRTLGEDIGERLGCGAHLQSLRRTKVGELSLKEAMTLPKIEEMLFKDYLKPVDYLLSSFPSLDLNEDLAKRFCHGQRLSLAKEGISCEKGRVRVYDANQKLLGTAIMREDGILAPERLIALPNA